MRYDKYIATGFSTHGIAVTIPCDVPQRAAEEFFKEYPRAGHCLIKRVSVAYNGNIVCDPEFEAQRVTKNRA